MDNRDINLRYGEFLEINFPTSEIDEKMFRAIAHREARDRLVAVVPRPQREAIRMLIASDDAALAAAHSEFVRKVLAKTGVRSRQ